MGRAWTRFGEGHGPPTQALLVKMHVKTKELGPVGGGALEILYGDPPMTMA